MKKRIISLLLSLVMVVGLLPVTAYADIAKEDMDTYAGKRITKIEFTASVNDENYSTTNTDSYAVSREITVGDQVMKGEKNTAQRIKFEITGMTWKQGKDGTPYTSTVEAANAVLELGNNGLRWKTGVVPYWKWVDSDADYLACQYNYMIVARVKDSQLGGADTILGNDGKGDDGYRIDPNVVVTVKWDDSDEGDETCSVDVYNNHDVKYGFISSYINATTSAFTVSEDGTLRLNPAGVSIPTGYTGEAIKPVSLALWANGGTKPYTFSKVSGPDWIDVSRDGKITGTPPASETGISATTLKVKVTDATGATATADISVGEMKAARTEIQRVELAGVSYPRVGDVIPQTPNVYISKIVAADGTEISKTDCPLYLTISRQWENSDGQAIYSTNEDYTQNKTFVAGGQYQFSVQIRLEGAENCANYYLPKTFTATVPRWGSAYETLTVSPTSYYSGENYASLFVDSELLTPVNTHHNLTGDVTYSGTARYGQTLTAKVAGLPTGVAESDLSYQWQNKHNDYDIWYDIDGATSKQLTLNEAHDNLIDRQIRVTVRCTGTNYAGTLYGAPLTVERNWNMAIPVKPVITYDAVNSKLTVTNESWKGEAETNPQEYAWTTSLTCDETTRYAVWPTTNEGTAQSLLPVTPGQTYYVYTRVEGSPTMEVGRIISAVAYTVPFADDGSSSGGGSGEPTIWATDMVYPDYDSKTPTIYLEKGEQINIRYQLNPNNANDNLPRWKETYDVINSVDVGDVTVTHDKDNKTITIQAPADATGTAAVIAYRNDELTEPWQDSAGSDSSAGRQITVMIYNPADLANVPFTKAYLGTTELYKGDTYEITKATLLDLPFVPADVEKNNYTLAAMFTTFGTGGDSGAITRSDTNAYVSLNSDADKFVIKGEDETGSSVYVEFFALPDNEVEVENYGRYAIAALSVTVKERPAQPERTATVSPGTLSLLAGETYQLQAYMTPTETGDSFTWSSDTASVATVDGSGKVTVAAGATAGSTATINATCDEGETAVSAACVITVKAPCGENHAYVYQECDWGHVKVCSLCGHSDNVILDHNMSWQESTETAGMMYGECLDCGYKTDLVNIPSNEVPADPTPGGNTPDTPNRPSIPNRPNLPNNPDSSTGGYHSGAGRPYRPDLSTVVPESTTATKPGSTVQSPGTGDAGIMLYAALSMLSMTGGAWLVSKKRREK